MMDGVGEGGGAGMQLGGEELVGQQVTNEPIFALIAWLAGLSP